MRRWRPLVLKPRHMQLLIRCLIAKQMSTLSTAVWHLVKQQCFYHLEQRDIVLYNQNLLKRASKKLKDKETELHLMSYKNVELEKLASMTMELQRWKSYALQLEARFSALLGAWQEYNTTRGIRLEGCSKPVREGEGESPQVEPDRVKPTGLNWY